MDRRTTLLASATLLAASTLAVGAATAGHADPAGQGAADPSVVTRWNALAVSAVTGEGGRGNASAFPFYAVTQLAVHDAVNGITHAHPLYRWDAHGPRGASPEAAAAVAAHDVLVRYVPAARDRLDAELAASLAHVPDGVSEDQGVRYGARAAARLLALRDGDGTDAPTTYPVGDQPGEWRPTPPAFAPALAPWMADLRPFVLASDDALRPGPPPAVGSAAHQADLAEVTALGARTSGSRTAGQTETARFFSDTPVGALQAALRDRVTRTGFDISDAAWLLAGVDVSVADAMIAVWDAKYVYRTWRPVTENGGSWSPLVTTPPYPEYPAGTPAVFAAASRALTALTGQDDLDLTLTSAAAGVTRHYADAAALTRDAVDGRVWGGVHYRTSDLVGAALGTAAADQVSAAFR